MKPASLFKILFNMYSMIAFILLVGCGQTYFGNPKQDRPAKEEKEGTPKSIVVDSKSLNLRRDLELEESEKIISIAKKSNDRELEPVQTENDLLDFKTWQEGQYVIIVEISKTKSSSIYWRIITLTIKPNNLIDKIIDPVKYKNNPYLDKTKAEKNAEDGNQPESNDIPTVQSDIEIVDTQAVSTPEKSHTVKEKLLLDACNSTLDPSEQVSTIDEIAQLQISGTQAITSSKVTCFMVQADNEYIKKHSCRSSNSYRMVFDTTEVKSTNQEMRCLESCEEQWNNINSNFNVKSMSLDSAAISVCALNEKSLKFIITPESETQK